MMNLPRPLLALAIALPLAGCISIGPKAPPFLMSLAPAQQRPVDAPRSAGPGEAVTVYVPGVPQALATTRVPVHSGPTSISYLKDAQWVEAPARLFQQLLATTIAARSGRVVLNPRQASIDPGVQVNGDLDRFGYDATTREAVVSFDAVRMNRSGERVENRRFEARVPVAAAEAHAVADGLNAAANRVAAQVSDWVVS